MKVDPRSSSGNMTPYTRAERNEHASHESGETLDDCPICWEDMTPGRFVRHTLEGLTGHTLLAKDETSWLMGLEFADGRRVMAIVYHPSVHGTWEVEVGDETWRAGHGFDRERDGCVDPAEGPSPIERTLGGDDNEG